MEMKRNKFIEKNHQKCMLQTRRIKIYWYACCKL